MIQNFIRHFSIRFAPNLFFYIKRVSDYDCTSMVALRWAERIAWLVSLIRLYQTPYITQHFYVVCLPVCRRSNTCRYVSHLIFWSLKNRSVYRVWNVYVVKIRQKPVTSLFFFLLPLLIFFFWRKFVIDPWDCGLRTIRGRQVRANNNVFECETHTVGVPYSDMLIVKRCMHSV